MKQVSFLRCCFVIVCLLTVISCKKEMKEDGPVIPPVVEDTTATVDLTQLKFSIVEATSWTELLKRSSGWIGGDGIFSIPFSGVDSIGAGNVDKTLLVFSDTQLGEIENGVLSTGWTIINNSVAIIDGNEPTPAKINFHWKTENNKPAAVFVPNTSLAGPKDYFWLGDGFVNHEINDETILFAYKIRPVNTGFGFSVAGSTVITIPKGSVPPFSNADQKDAPLFVEGDRLDNGYAFGAGILVNTAKAGAPKPDGFVYVYGVKNLPGVLNKGLMVGRAKPSEFKDFSKWRFWDGTAFTISTNDLKNATVITDRVSDELSMTPLPDGRYALIFQSDIWGSVGLRLAQTPHGPFGPVIPLWDCKEALTGKDYFAYNAKAHPNLSKPGELLISFNINSFSYFNDLQTDPNLYRPRFIKLTFL